MSEDFVKALLEDSNIPLELRHRVCVQMRSAFRNGTRHIPSLEMSWKYAASSLSTESLCRGPYITGLPKEVRVARLMSANTFMRYFAEQDMSALYGPPDFQTDTQRTRSLSSLDRTAIRPSFTGGSPGRAVWTTLTDNTRGLSADELVDELAVMHFALGEHLVLVDYSIRSNKLRVPTVLDAALQPWFQPKPRGELPRSWNWSASRWGLVEAVHPPGIEATNPSVRYLGQLTRSERPNLDRTARFSLRSAAQIEKFLEGVLRQVFAHIELAPFLSGDTDLLDVSHREFELFVGTLFAREGYLTTVTRASKDGGFDVIAVSDRRSSEGLLIQAKHTARNVGIRILRELVGARFLADPAVGNYRLALATTGQFTKPVEEAAKQRPAHFVLRDYEDLTKAIAHFRNVDTTDIYYSQIVKAQDAT